MEMRRKNMLALGLSAVLCAGIFAPASYADSITKDTYVPEVEKTAETAGTAEGLDDFPEETAVEGKTAFSFFSSPAFSIRCSSSAFMYSFLILFSACRANSL